MKSSRETSRVTTSMKSSRFSTVFENEADSLDSSSSKGFKLSKRATNVILAKKSLTALVPRNTDKFAKLKYDQNKEILFNLDCQVQILIGYFEKKFKKELDESDEYGNDKLCKFDLIDDQGQAKNIQDESNQTKSALLLFEPRKTYILAKIKHNEQKESIIIPLAKTPEIPVKSESPSIKNYKKNSISK